MQSSPGTLTISLDGNFGLCRKKAAGTSVHGPLHQEGTACMFWSHGVLKLQYNNAILLVFLDQAEVDNFVESYSYKSISMVSYLHLVFQMQFICLNKRTAVTFWLKMLCGQM